MEFSVNNILGKGLPIQARSMQVNSDKTYLIYVLKNSKINLDPRFSTS